MDPVGNTRRFNHAQRKKNLQGAKLYLIKILFLTHYVITRNTLLRKLMGELDSKENSN